MAFHLDQVVPWGRSLDEYQAMFALDGRDLSKRIIGCGDGPASFNGELTAQGGRVVSVDPVYRFKAAEIAARIEKTYPDVLEQTRQNAGDFVWASIQSVEQLGQVRMKAMGKFLVDYPLGKQEGRYVDAELPRLPFANQTFDLALCSHFLFLYSEHFDAGFHLQSLRELCRVAGEARVFPLLEFGTVKSRHLEGVLAQLAAEDYRATVEKVPYEFQRGGNEMLVVSRQPPTFELTA